MPLKNNYGIIDSEHGTTPYVLPPFACGWYEYTGEYGDKTVYQFRRMPRAGKHTGKYGLWLKDPDAGMVLIGVVKPAMSGGQVLAPEPGAYQPQFLRFRAGFSVYYTDMNEKVLKLIKRACSWCGRELLDATRLCHDSPKCQPKTS